ncbi:hypothetical protein [Roseimaritima ulvae]|nr:hypothetical protein [Roseimaritima ulvae]
MSTPDESAEPPQPNVDAALDRGAADIGTGNVGGESDEAATSDEAIVATLVDDPSIQQARTGEVRTGSPFVVDPPAVRQRAAAALKMRREFEAGLWRLTAASAVIAAGMLVVFAAIAFWVFQTGALLIAGLGGVMSLLGLTSIYPRWAFSLLLIHTGLFVGTFWLTMRI